MGRVDDERNLKAPSSQSILISPFMLHELLSVSFGIFVIMLLNILLSESVLLLGFPRPANCNICRGGYHNQVNEIDHYQTSARV